VLGDTNIFVDNWLQISSYFIQSIANSNCVAIQTYFLDNVVTTPVSWNLTFNGRVKR